MLYREIELNKFDIKIFMSYCKELVFAPKLAPREGYYSAGWVIPARILDITPAEYAKLLVEKYNAKLWYNPKNGFVSKTWDNQLDERRWRNFINKKAREKNFQF